MEQKTAFTHCHIARGHLVAKVLAPNAAQREVPIITSEIGAFIDGMGDTGKGKCFVLDLSEVRLLSSMGIGMCVDLKNRADRAHMKAVLFGAVPSLLELLKLMRVDRLYAVAADQKALDKLLG